MASNKYMKLGSNIISLGCGAIGGILVAYTYDRSYLREVKSQVDQTRTTSPVTPEVEQAHGVCQFPEETLSKRLEESIQKAEKLCERIKSKKGLPGLSVAVSVNGVTRWAQGFGFANLENDVKMEPNTVVRIASISKSMTMGMLGKYIENGQIDLDLPVQTYVPNFPRKEVNGKEVIITTRHLLTHLSGIRHYSTKAELDALKPGETIDEMDLKEYFLKKKFESVEKALQIFQNDELLHEPGSKYYYTTHGWTLVSAVLENVSGKPFEKYAKQVFKIWGLKNTFLDEPEPIIYQRAAPYNLDKKTGEIVNAPYVDNSYKWAGGGFLSTAGDIVQFGNIMLASYQNKLPDQEGPSQDSEATSWMSLGLPISQDQVTSSKGSSPAPAPFPAAKGYLKSETMEAIWTGDQRTANNASDLLYGLGFKIGEPMRQCLFCKSRELMTVGHSGAAIGGSSYLQLTFPKDIRFGPDETDKKLSVQTGAFNSNQGQGQVKGIAIAMLTNLTDVGLRETAEEITKLFEWLI